MIGVKHLLNNGLNLQGEIFTVKYKVHGTALSTVIQAHGIIFTHTHTHTVTVHVHVHTAVPCSQCSAVVIKTICKHGVSHHTITCLASH